MGRRCCIDGCPSSSRLPEHHGVTYHSFPLDPIIRGIWIRNTKLSVGRNITKSVLVCSRHFRRVDFQTQRSGKFVLKPRVFPTVFPWGKEEPEQIEADSEILQNAAVATTLNATVVSNVSANEDETKATVEATVAQILAETAELSAKTNDGDVEKTGAGTLGSAARFERVTNFSTGVRIEAQDFEGIWHTARIVEIDNDDREVLIKFERNSKSKSAVDGTEEWIPMNSTRLRQKISSKPIPVFEMEEKCMARWSGPRKFPGTVKKILSNDMYEVLFDDGYVKNVRAIHMSKILTTKLVDNDDISNTTLDTSSAVTPSPTVTPITERTNKTNTITKKNGRKRSASVGRKDWPLLDMSKLDLESLNLPEIPRDGEWTCHWVNDQPIGREGFLIVGEHRKPTVIVDDWRLPSGWVKHMYQRSNVLGKWDVILVTPNNKRFRSKADLKTYLEEQGKVYNPDIYDFSIHRRRAKDLNAYVYTPDYTSNQVGKQAKTVLLPNERAENSSPSESAELIAEETKAALESSLAAANNSSFLETPVASHLPPMELMTSPVKTDSVDGDHTDTPSKQEVATIKTSTNSEPADTLNTSSTEILYNSEFAYIGGLKVAIIDNLFRCPQEGCLKNFRKENHLQIHIKHYHLNLVELMGACPKMQELAEKRTSIIAPDINEPQPKNQIPNQQFFAKLHQQDLQQSRAHRKAISSSKEIIDNEEQISKDSKIEITEEIEIKEQLSKKKDAEEDDEISETKKIDSLVKQVEVEETVNLSEDNSSASTKPHQTDERFSPLKRPQASRKSNRQRTTRHYFTPAVSSVVTADSSAGVVADLEETRHDFNITPEVKVSNEPKRRRTTSPIPFNNTADSPITADSGSGSFSAYADLDAMQKPQYIKENGELIKIVRMRQEEIINCMCQYDEEDGLMIQCELCLCWQHGVCNGIEKESDVPEKYVCYICRNPSKARESLRFKHDQEWLYDGRLPVANYHIPNPKLTDRFEFLKKSHVLSGNLIDLKRFMYSLRVKINIAHNRCHPKLYLWAKDWDDDEEIYSSKEELNVDSPSSESGNAEEIDEQDAVQTAMDDEEQTEDEKIEVDEKMEVDEKNTIAVPHIPQPEAAIDPEECQQRLIDHIKIQQNILLKRLEDIEIEIDDIEANDDLNDLKHDDTKTVKESLAIFIRELETVKQLANVNAVAADNE